VVIGSALDDSAGLAGWIFPGVRGHVQGLLRQIGPDLRDWDERVETDLDGCLREDGSGGDEAEDQQY
jgi:hypothetical protein